MRTDWDVVCDRCKVSLHIGQGIAGGARLGYGNMNVDDECRIANFINDHIDTCGGLRVMVSEAVPGDYRHIYRKDPLPEVIYDPGLSPDCAFMVDASGKMHPFRL